MALRVDEIPLIIRPFFLAFSWILAAILWLSIAFFRATCRIEYEGLDILKDQKSFILVTWHENLPLFFMTFLQMPGKQIWLNHPIWFMKPIHFIMQFMGVKKLALGSSGHSGKAALESVIEHLKQGWSTSVNPDGPAGPPHKAKAGAIIMSKAANIPIIPIGFIVSHEWRLPTWDRKRIPFPFAKVRVVLGPAMTFQSKVMDQDILSLEAALDAN